MCRLHDHKEELGFTLFKSISWAVSDIDEYWKSCWLYLPFKINIFYEFFFLLFYDSYVLANFMKIMLSVSIKSLKYFCGIFLLMWA